MGKAEDSRTTHAKQSKPGTQQSVSEKGAYEHPPGPSHVWCKDDSEVLSPHKDKYSSQRVRGVFKSNKIQFPPLASLPQLWQTHLTLLLCFHGF